MLTLKHYLWMVQQSKLLLASILLITVAGPTLVAQADDAPIGAPETTTSAGQPPLADPAAPAAATTDAPTPLAAPTEPATVAPAAATTPAKPKPAPYAVPWQLRPLVSINVLRLDVTPLTYHDKNNQDGMVTTSSLIGGRAFTKSLMGIVRLVATVNRPADGAADATSIANPAFGLMRVSKLNPQFKLGYFAAVTAPIGSGGSSKPNKFRQAANPVGALSRAAMDNALFAVNYGAFIPGVGLAYLAHNFTVQAEATLFALARVRGSAIDKDAFRLNGTAGLSVGYTFAPSIAAIAELHYQRWLINDTVAAAAEPARQNLSVMVGPRFAIKTSRFTMRPGIAVGVGLAGAIASDTYTSPVHGVTTVFADVPVIF